MNGAIEVEVDGRIAKVTMCRQEKLNSVTRKMLEDFEEKVSALANDPEIMGILFTGEGERAFSAGFDLKTVESLEGEAHHDFFKLLESAIQHVRCARNCLTVAAINGYAVGFGAILAAACDIRFFSDDAVFRLPEVDLGIFPGAGAASNLIALVGPAHTKDILLTGRKLNAQEAFRIGLATRVLPKEEVLPYAVEFLKKLTSKDRKVVIRTKNLIDGMTGAEQKDAADMESMYLEEWLREYRDI
ncbi:enoyl-CoA hydratase/isomerase family protein [Candidatus Thorarchaeota archaeon]|nr:MAG: enoyl-CoA hydratase/isomerase family protein [Candidatus Thorarchaeota archaeon]